jgi:Ca2+:H+ antiporter
MRLLLKWTTIFPTLAWALYFSGLIRDNGGMQLLATALLVLSVMSAVHYSEIIAQRVGEPFGTIILAVAVTVIEVSIIISLMVTGGKAAISLARDTVFSAIMLIMNGIIGMCLFIGGWKYREQNFSKHSASIALVCLVSIVVLTLVFPTFTTSIKGPFYSTPQLIFVSIACLVIYSVFLLAQTSRHREYFLPGDTGEQENTVKIPNVVLAISLIFLFVSLGIVVLLAKTLSPAIERLVLRQDLPKAMVGIIISMVILLPEGIAAIIAASKNRLQTSMNLSLGSALASIALTIPIVVIVCSLLGMEVILGLDIKSILLLGLSVFIVMLSLSSGRTNLVYGVVLLVNLFAYIFMVIYP